MSNFFQQNFLLSMICVVFAVSATDFFNKAEGKTSLK
jgi:hypothetical protein